MPGYRMRERPAKVSVSATSKQSSSKPTSAKGKKPKVEKAYEVEKVLAVQIGRNGEKLFEVKWVGFSKTTWEPEQNLENCEDKKREFMDIIGL